LEEQIANRQETDTDVHNGDVDPKSMEMRISGFDLVPALCDPQDKLVVEAGFHGF